ncbi:putative late blight resistance protein homolog R1A-10 isoform X2 [Salvia hispanica]|uniref:putative late blight resistance protein homolog R1A-10 isoform X2 n=1 Tax=Salvia hispanica TaxID=49212 RepID=UPI00200928BC|nr:putative late blight resistance protein homolog R1A-10 isoform X2 [Salvia hispanica]
MAAYAALVSLKRIIDDIETHPSPPISLDKQQVQSLTQIVTFLQEFLEGYKSPYEYSDEADPLEIHIMAQAVEDVIESYIIDTIKLSDAATDDGGDEQISCIHFYQDLQNVIENMDLIKKEVTAITMEKEEHKRNVASDDVGLRFNSTGKKHLMIGFDDMLLQLLDRLTDANTNRKIIPIVGMGGIGKTTLAKGAFEHKLIKEHFDICVWTTISQDYNIVETLREVLTRAGESSSSMDEKELEVRLHKCLWGSRYLIILDDMWSIDVWDRLKFSFPDCGEGSRLVVTTRMSNLAAQLTDSYSLVKIGFLDEVSSWTLFSKIVFGEQSFLTQLESIGKKIVKKCNGLPLSIVVIGGLMAKSEVTLEYWEHIEENLASIVNSENEDYCLRILKLSYNYLPAYLKPCFLYMGVFEEDKEITASTVVRLWISEGFLKPIVNKSLTRVAEQYLKELVDRNLILVHKSCILGDVLSYKIHDLLRDLSMKESEKQRFFYVLRDQSPQGLIGQQRIVIPESTLKEKIKDALEYMLHARSYLVFGNQTTRRFPNSRFLRLSGCWVIEEEYLQLNVFELMNSRYHRLDTYYKFVIPSSINLLWNLDTLIISFEEEFIAPSEIWKMYKLRHLEFEYRRLHLPEPPSADDDIIMMENLEVLKGVINFNISEDIVKRIPNIEELDMTYEGQLMDGVDYLSCLLCLSKLESLELWAYSPDVGKYLQKINFPPSLKELFLSLPSDSEWEDILPTIGSLPLLETLELNGGRFRTREWETMEDHFQSLKSLKLYECGDLEKWTVTESSHFPLLIQLHLFVLDELKEIPAEIGEISTLRSIKLYLCNESVVLSAKQIFDEQQDLHGDQIDLLVHATVWMEDESLQKLATSNFKVIVHSIYR